MKRWLNNFWWNYEDAIFFILFWIVGIVVVVGGLTIGIGYGVAKQDQYNCNLERRPSFSTTFWINHDTYGYNPDRFCAQLKEKMAQE